MPSVSTTIEDFSPLLSYAGTWVVGSSQNDGLLSSYSQASFMTTQTQGSSVSFTFNGTGVQLFGAMRGNHGLYQVSVDGIASAAVNGASPDPGIFQTSLFSTTSLQQGLHTVTLTNQQNEFVDLDFITWQTNIGEANEDLIINTIDDTSPDFQFSPASSWSNQPGNIGSFMGSTGHSTVVAGSSLTYAFIGDGVSLFGPIGPSYAGYSVQIDGGLTTTFSANQANFIPQAVLFHADDLGAGAHVLTLLYEPQQPGQVLAIDYATTYSTKSLGGTVSGSVDTATVATSSTAGLSSGSIAGIVIAVLIALAIVCGGLFYVYILRRRRSAMRWRNLEKMAYSENYASKSGKRYSDVVLSNPPNRASSFIMNPPAIYTDSVPMQLSMTVRNPVSTSSESFTGMDDVYARNSMNYRNSGSAQSYLGSSSSISNSTSPRGSNPRTQFRTKGQPVDLPEAAGQSLQLLPPEELAEVRMQVPGRPQDFGSVPNADAVVIVEERREVNPPPNYSQATQSYPPR